MTQSEVTILCRRAKEEGVKFLTIASVSSIEGLAIQAPGTLLEYEGIFSSIFDRVERFPRRYLIKPYKPEMWNDILKLAQYRSPNRFFTDPNFNKLSVFEHKIKLYAMQLKGYPNLAYLAYSKYDEPLGFHICSDLTTIDDSEKDSTLLQYELIVRPDYRTGGVALDLVSACLRAAALSNKNYSKLVTKIYSDNIESQKFFSNLGLKVNNQKYAYHHIWL